MNYLYVLIVSLALLFDVLAGPLRFYAESLNLSFIVYIPKIAFVVLVPFLLILKKNSYIIWYYILLVFVFSVLGVTTSGLYGTLFGIYVLVPVFMGLLFPINSQKQIVLLSNVFKIMFVLVVFGIWLDYFFELPWQGFEQTFFDRTIVSSRFSSSFGIERVVGFSRISAASGIYVAILTLFFLVYSKNILIKLIIGIIALISITVTIQKSAFFAFLFVTPLFFYRVRKHFLLPAVLVPALLGLLLPLYFSGHSIKLKLDSISSLVLLASFEDRILNTWPKIYNTLLNYHQSIEYQLSYITGMGIGSFGTPAKYFSSNHLLGVADNIWVYMQAMMGIIGVLVMFYIVYVIYKLLSMKYNRLYLALGLTSLFTLWVGITTDVIESTILSFIIGFSVSLHYKSKTTKIEL